MVRQLHPNARDAAQRKVNRITGGVIAASVAATLAVGAGIAYAAPPPKPNNKTDYGQKSKKAPAGSPTKAPAAPADAPVAQPQQPQQEQPRQQEQPPPPPADDKPESSTGDEETTSGGS
ncbi:MAG TPA: hypothetical protein VFV67_21115 [Actinophytocola sp.]|uniref:hypothetical protein n=1 Tax=Actinophytocola sp. TaxID=1872138 RepID=UPI002DB5C4D1|nr:hypothetical protein [Actinophytocola sp.]HEU5473154.1 hypothetical protein [Actinophytocola sp.]